MSETKEILLNVIEKLAAINGKLEFLMENVECLHNTVHAAAAELEEEE